MIYIGGGDTLFMLDHWKYYIVNSFIRVNGKRMSNGPMESANGRLGRLIDDGYGYTNFIRFYQATQG